MYKEKIVDIQTGEETFRDLSKSEIAQITEAQKEAAEYSAAIEAKKAAKLEVLTKLGLTETEATILFS